MAFASSVVWEVRPSGNDANGGGFDPTSGTPGTDYSQQDSPQVTYTDLVIDAATNTKCTSAGTPFTSAHVGNIINITSGTGFTVQRVQVMSVAANVATCDKSLGTLGSTGGNGKLGGGFATLGAIIGSTLPVAGNTVYVKSGTSYTITSRIDLGSSGSDSAGAITCMGYQTTHGDNTGTRPILTSATNSVNLIGLNAKNRWRFSNMKFTHTAGTRGDGFNANAGNANYITIDNCVFDGLLVAIRVGNIGAESGIANGLCVINNEILNCTSDAIQAVVSSGGMCVYAGNYIHDNTGNGLRLGNQSAGSGHAIVCNIFDTNGGDNINIGHDQPKVVLLWGNVSYNATSDGFESIVTSSNPLMLAMLNNIFDTNGAFGAKLANSAAMIGANRNNAYRNNTSGARNNLSAGTSDVTPTGDPFTNAASGDFSLDNTSNEGAALRAAGFPGVYPGGLTTGYLDIGAVQHQDAGGGGTTILYPVIGG